MSAAHPSAADEADAAPALHAPAQQARAFAPGSVGNIGVGFDVLGHSIEGVRDVATVRRIDEPAVRIRAIRGGKHGDFDGNEVLRATHVVHDFLVKRGLISDRPPDWRGGKPR